MDWIVILTLEFSVLWALSIYFLRRFYKRQLRYEVLRAQKSERIKTVFLANVSHALRTPLNAIIGFSDIVLKDKTGEVNREQVVEMMTHINRNGQQLLYFISQLLELSNFEGNMLTFTMVEVNLGELMASYRREVLFEVKPDVSVVVKTSLSPHCKVMVDTNLMHQLVMHLLNNAARYTKKGTITLTYEYENKGLRFTVADTGDGIAAKYIDTIFSALQVHNSLTLANQATGLGLSICKAIVEAQNGTINLTSEEGKGTQVDVWLPCEMKDMYKGLMKK